MSTTECCLTKAVDSDTATAERTETAFPAHLPSSLWHQVEAMPNE